MKKRVIKLVLFIFVANIFGCATPKGMVWHKEGNSIKTTNADIHDCKVSTFLWWPFDTLYRCMHRRGYVLIGEDEDKKVTEQKPVNNQSNFSKLMELKQLKENGIISTEEYERKREKYLLKY